MSSLSMPKFILKRLNDDWKLLLSVFIGIVLASSLVSGAPVYLNSLQRLGINTAIDRSSSTFLDIFIFAPNVPLTAESLAKTDQLLDDSIQSNVPDLYLTRERYLKGNTLLVGTPRTPLTDVQGVLLSRGYLQSMTNLEHHVEFQSGRMASDVITQGDEGPVMEGVIGTSAARTFALEVGDRVVMAPTAVGTARITIEVVGIVEPIDPTEEYWQHSANIFLSPQPLDEVPDLGVEVDPEEPPLAMFVTREVMTRGLGDTYPGTLVGSTWFVFVDNEAIKSLSIDQARSKITNLQNEVSQNMPGAAVFTGIKTLLTSFERRSFFSSVPLLLLLTIMVITVLYYMGMMVSYLVQSRETDVALLRSRGVSTPQLLKLYGLEGAVLTIVAVILAPFLSMAAIALSGKLPYFSALTGGELLPVEFKVTPFVVALGIGIVSLAIYVAPGILSARTTLVIHKLRSSRPPSVPAFQRYYIDVLLIVIGGLVFWEMAQRGQIVSGGLFTSVKVNEAMLLAPVLVLTTVALLFMRFFPLFVRFISGESSDLLHLVVAATVLLLSITVVIRELIQGDSTGWLLPVLVLVGFGAAYWAVHNAQSRRSLWFLYAAQIIFVGLFIYFDPIRADRGSFAATTDFFLKIGLLAVIPARLAFVLLRAWAQIAPVWVTMGLWHMARNPLQYSWLVLMLVMVTGLGVLATTVGGTLDRSYRERVLYDTGADIRVTGIPSYFASSNDSLQEVYKKIPGVKSVSLALRGAGSLGSNSTGAPFELLGLNAQEFSRISWYRDDFSENPFNIVMGSLKPRRQVEPIRIPDDATTLGLWANPADPYPNMFMWLVVQDSRGVVRTLTLGKVGNPGWHFLTTDMPSNLVGPVDLVSVQLFEPVFGPSGTPGSIAIDDIQATIASGQVVVLEDFESRQSRWSSLATSMLSTDSVVMSTSNVFNDNASGIFTFGKDTDRGIRGFYHSPTGGPIPIVVSSTFLRATGVNVRDTFIVELLGRLVPVTVEDEVDFFPTMRHTNNGFVLADLDGLLRHVNIVSPASAIRPNEIFITEAAEAGNSVRDVVAGLVGSNDLVRHRGAQLEAISLDPLITAGWKAMVLLSVGIIILTTGLGYVTYLLAFADKSRAEIGFLLSMGLSKRQMIGLLSMEHIVIILIGLGLGTWAGFQMSTLMVSSVAITERGNPVVPPFIMMTDWSVMIPIYAVLMGIFAVSIFRLGRSMSRLNLHTLSRVEG